MSKKHQELVTRLKKRPADIAIEISVDKCDLIHMSMGISGEAGELLDAIKKHAIYDKSLDLENIIEELGDLEFYMEGMRQTLNLTREEILEHNINKLTKRYGTAYSNKAAQERKDKV